MLYFRLETGSPRTRAQSLLSTCHGQRRVARIGALLLVCASLLLVGCLEIRSTIDLQADGSGVHEMQFVAIKRELDQLGPATTREVEEKIRKSIQEKITKEQQAGKRLQQTEFVDDEGNRVFSVKEQFAHIREFDDASWDCGWTATDIGFLTQRYQLKCRFTSSQSIGNGPVKIPFKLRIRMPGNVQSSNGIRRSEREAEWIFNGGWRRGTTVEVSAEGTAVPTSMITVAAGAILAALIALGGIWYLRRRPASMGASRAPGSIGAARSLQSETAVACPSCGSANASGAKFCRSCGASLPIERSAGVSTVACSACGAKNAVSAKFCRACGASLTAATAVERTGTASATAQVTSQVDGTAAPATLMPTQWTTAEALPRQVAQAASAPATMTGALTPRVPKQEPATAAMQSAPATVAAGTPTARAKALPAPRGGSAPWTIPAVAAVILALIGGGVWFGYAKWSGMSRARSETTVATSAPTPQSQSESTSTIATPVAPAVPFTPPVPMARDGTNGCHVWKPDLQPNETVKWTGRCANSMAEGQGKAEWFVDGKPGLTYEGTFKAGMLQGTGRMTAPGGDSYEGEYVDGQRHGSGTYVAANGERYAGQWKANKRDGVGTLTYANGDRYEGEFKDNRRHGKGTFKRPDGETYVGEYIEDRREGSGLLVRADGSRYEGLFKDGKPVGQVLPPQQTVAKAALPTPTPAPSVSQPVVPPRAQAQPIPPATTVPAPAGRAVQRTEDKKQLASAPALPAPMPPSVPAPSVPAPSVQSPSRDSALAERPAPPPPIAQTTPNDACSGLSGLKLEQCRSCRQSDRVQRLLCEQKTRFTYCLGRGAGTLDCAPAQPARQDGGA